MSLPISDNRTRAGGDRVSRADILSIQDAQIGIYQRGRRLQRAFVIAGVAGRAISGWTRTDGGAAGYYRQATGAAQVVIYPVPVPVGWRIRSLEIRTYRAAAPMDLSLYRAAYPDASEFLGGLSPGTLSAWATHAAAPTGGSAVVRPGRYYLALTAASSGDRVSWLKVYADRP